MIKGYKAFRKGLITQSDTILELNKTYYINGNITWNKKGFHFCSYPEDTLRYMRDFEEETQVAEVLSNGDIIEYEDDYNGYYDMYVSNQIKVTRVLSREELFNLIVSRGENSILRMIQNYTLTMREMEFLRDRSARIEDYITYYQLGDKDTFQRRLK